MRTESKVLKLLCALLAHAVLLTLSCANEAPVEQLEAEYWSPPPRTTFAPRTASIPDEQPRPAALRLLEETRFTLDVQDADLPSLLLGIGRDGPFNTVIAPEVTGRVTVDFRDTSLRQILDELLIPRGYYYKVQGNFLRITAGDISTRTYRVDYPNYQRRGNSDLTIEGAIATSPDIGASGGRAADDVSSTSIRTTQESDFWAELEIGLQFIVHGSAAAENTPEGTGRNLVMSRQSGLLTVTGEPKVLQAVESFLEEIARSTQRQVLIDCRILEIDIGDGLEFGVDWEIAANLGSAEGVFDRNIKPGFKDAFSIADLAPALTGGGFLFGIASDEIGVVLAALAEERNVRVVSTPRLATLNNHKALIKVVRNEVFFIAEVETEILQTVGAAQTTEFVPQVIPVGVTLDITPQISNDGHITMHIHPSISEIVDIVPQPKGDPDLESFGSLPVIDLRETDTVMRVRDQETILIGGLIQSSELRRESKIPVLGDIPYLGQLFRLTDVEEKRTELVILVKPTILDAPMITQVRLEAEESINSLDGLRGDRLKERPWWRRPFGEYYGVRPDDEL